MIWQNVTSTKEFVLLGLSSDPQTQVAIFVIFLLFYFITLTGNCLIIFVTITRRNLQTPMYFFLTNLSFLDIFYSSTNIPRALKDLMSMTKIITFGECALQMYTALSLAITECFLLAVMAYDRYIAVCYPLHYTTIVNGSVCIKAAVFTWVCGFLLSTIQTATTLNVPLCGHYLINHFFCEGPGFLSLGCADTFVNEVVTFILCVLILMIPFSFIFLSYTRIILIIVKMTSSVGRKKTFSTCASHITGVTLYFGTCIAMYMKPRSLFSPDRDKIIAIFYVVITPMLNPLIYTLRNKEIKSALKNVNFFCKKNVANKTFNFISENVLF